MTVGALFESATALLDRRQLTAVWLPLLVFVGTLATVAVAGVGWDTAHTWWRGLGAEGSAALVLALALLTILLGQLLTAWRTGLIRLLSGDWPALPGLTWLGRQLTAHHQRVHAARTAANPTLFLGYPRRADRVLPTRLGNVLRAAEEHADRYGLDAVAAWPRLYVVLPEQFVAAFAGTATYLEAAVTISVLAAVFTLLGGGLAAALLPWYGAVACVWGGIIVALLGYRAAARAAVPYAQLVRTAFDVHRFALLEAMRLEPPPSFGAEREQWRQLGKVWYSGWPDSDRASALRYPQPADQPAAPAGPSLPVSTESSVVSRQPEAATPSPPGAPSAAAAAGTAGPPRLFPVRMVALVVALSLGGVAAIVAAHRSGERAGSAPVAAQAVPAFHVLTPADVRGRPDSKELDEILGRYTVRATAKGQPLRTRDLGPKLPGGALIGRTVVAVPTTGLADRIGRGDRVTLVVVAPHTGPPAPPEHFIDILVLDRLAGDPRPLVVAVPSTRLDRLLALAAGASVHVIVE